MRVSLVTLVLALVATASAAAFLDPGAGGPVAWRPARPEAPIVWRDSVKLGCAVGNCPGIAYPNSIVCDYGPGGNFGGQRPY